MILAIKYKTCIKCGSKDTADIIYGLPSYELISLVEAKKVKLGGCCIVENAPDYFCYTCQHEWNKEDAINYAYSQIMGIRVSTGNFFDGLTQVEIDLVSQTSTWVHMGIEKEEIQKKELDLITIENFMKELKYIRLLNWKSKYKDITVFDGMEWNLEIINPKKIINKSGENVFPKEWDYFCKLIKEITNKEL